MKEFVISFDDLTNKGQEKLFNSLNITIMFDDLKTQKQQKLLQMAGITSPEDGCYDVFPLVIFEWETPVSTFEETNWDSDPIAVIPV